MVRIYRYKYKHIEKRYKNDDDDDDVEDDEEVPFVPSII